MRNLLIATAALGLLADRAPAGQTYTPLQGTFGPVFDNGVIHAVGFNPVPLSGSGLGNLYDNISTVLGGAARPYCGGPFGDLCQTQAFADWVAPSAQWGDDLQGISQGGLGPAVVTRLYYGYANLVATSTHIIKIYDMVPPGVVPSVTAPIEKGVLLTSIVVTANPTGGFLVTVTGLDFQIPQSAVWIKFEQGDVGFLDTLWLTGGNGDGVGTTQPGILYSVKNAPPYPYDLWFPFSSFYFTGIGYVGANIQVAMSGFHVPAPATIGLLALGGLIALRRPRSTLTIARRPGHLKWL